MEYRVYDDRGNKTIYMAGDWIEAMKYTLNNYGEEHPDFPHIWIERIGG